MRYKLTFAFYSAHFAGRFVAKRYISLGLQQKCLNGQTGTCQLGTRWCNV